MVKLYRSAGYLYDWVAYRDDLGWVLFPAEQGGWARRRPAPPLAVDQLSQVPVWLSFNTGLLEEIETRARRAAA
jgi:hypothetical protein